MGGGNFNVLPPNSSSTDERLAAEIMGHSVVEIDEQVSQHVGAFFDCSG